MDDGSCSPTFCFLWVVILNLAFLFLYHLMPAIAESLDSLILLFPSVSSYLRFFFSPGRCSHICLSVHKPANS